MTNERRSWQGSGDQLFLIKLDEKMYLDLAKGLVKCPTFGTSKMRCIYLASLKQYWKVIGLSSQGRGFLAKISAVLRVDWNTYFK